ncbi:extracellular solute-binding protein [Anaeromyxobacter oryzae]|uniref:Maltotriose-binding protein n=1 Tax=Anaeromyxobacter oryzae TaxID=2918170 RepID=A0ABN6MQM4_9BACT|nr:extracellular solute-binding protein [Anaeromyxobacter oryzae]BDG03245.1 maltotriose-binding protein [Anaeromyxobacter oryzae]
MTKLLAILLAAAVLPARSLAAELVVWHAYRGAEKTAFEKVVAAYNARPGAQNKVTTLAVPYDAFADKITAAVPRGKGPDVFIYAQDRLGGWIEAGNTVEPIDFYVDDALKGRFIPTTVEALTYRGSLWGLPLNYKVVTLIYNKKLVTQPPKTTDELVALGKKLTNRAAGRFGLAYPYNDFYYDSALFNGLGGGVFDAKGAPTLDAPENVKAFELLMKWVKQDGFLPAEPSSALITSLFNEGKAAMVFSGPWFLGEVKPGIDVGLAPLPTITEAGGKPMKPWMTVEGVYVAAPSKNKEAAFDFVKYVTDVGSARTLALEGRQSPANKQVYEDAKVSSDVLLEGFRKQVEAAVPMPNVPEMTMVWSPATTALNTLIRGSATPKDALAKAQAQVAKDVATLRKGK